jgi:hypothetical protein
MSCLLFLSRHVVNTTFQERHLKHPVCAANLLVNILIADLRRLRLPPQRGKEKVAPGKGAQRLSPWVTCPPTPTPLFLVFRADLPGRHGRPRKEGNIHYCSATQGGASLALGYYLLPLRGFRLARYARKGPNMVLVAEKSADL